MKKKILLKNLNNISSQQKIRCLNPNFAIIIHIYPNPPDHLPSHLIEHFFHIIYSERRRTSQGDGGGEEEGEPALLIHPTYNNPNNERKTLGIHDMHFGHLAN